MTMTSHKPHVWDGSGTEAAAAEVALAETLASLPAHDVTSPREVRRGDVIQLAHAAWEDDTTTVAVLDALALYHPALDEETRADRLGNLISELVREQQIKDHEIDPDPGETRDDIELAAGERINHAADQLIGDLT